ncbi:MAG: TRAM domain-containing protein, partial [Nevskia sp.]|nr:TRAM domain-containing protein [Nevskia sp.]
MEKQAAISSARLRRKIGEVLEVLVDEAAPDGVVGRSWADAPEIDGKVYIAGKLKPLPGQRVRVKISRADTHDLHGKLA